MTERYINIKTEVLAVTVVKETYTQKVYLPPKSDQLPDENIYENIDGNIYENKDENLYKNSDENSDENSNENSDENSDENDEETSPELKKKFLLKSFSFLFVFNLIISIPTIVLVLIQKDFNNTIAGWIFVGVLIVLSAIIEFQPTYTLKNNKIFFSITVIYGLALMGLSFFLSYPKCTLYFLATLFINNILFILISLIPFSNFTGTLMIVSNVISVIAGAGLQEFSYFHFEKDTPEYLALGRAILFDILVVVCHSLSACVKTEIFKENENYKYLFMTQIYIMVEIIIVICSIFYYIYRLIVFLCKVAGYCLTFKTIEDKKKGISVTGGMWGNYFIDIYGKRYIIKKRKKKHECNIF